MLRIHTRIWLSLMLGAAVACGAPPPPPNVVLILVDDLGYGDLSYTGAPDIRTPHIDRLAQDGAYFSQFYTSAPVCSPTRAGLLTGRYQQRTGVDRVIFADERDRGMDHRETLLPAYLKERGYATGIVGKWHLGYPQSHFPTRRGFDTFFGFVAGNIDHYTHHERFERPDLWRNETAVTEPGYMTELLTAEAEAFIAAHRAGPFFLYVAHGAPHAPIQAPGETQHDRYPDGSRYFRGPGTRALYAAMVEAVDASVGRILAALESHGLRENTLVMFLSDNGGTRHGRNAPYHNGKGNLYEGGIRTPLMLRWPARIAPGTVVDAPGISLDLFPTVLAAAGGALPGDRAIDGRNLLPLIDGSATRHHTYLCWKYQTGMAIRRGPWKFHITQSGEERLTDLTVDVGETGNAIEDHPALAAELKALLLTWESDVTGTDRDVLPPRGP